MYMYISGYPNHAFNLKANDLYLIPSKFNLPLSEFNQIIKAAKRSEHKHKAIVTVLITYSLT